MATKAGCAASYAEVEAPAGVQSAGACKVHGRVVDFRVQQSINYAEPWPTSDGQRRPTYVGNGWIVHTDDATTLNEVGARLTP